MMFRNLATSLFRHEGVETTVQKAKELRPIVEKLITIAREDSLVDRRRAYDYLKDKAVVHKLFAEIGPRFKTRNGGYTRIVRSRHRMGDAAEMAWISLVERTAPVAKKAAKADKVKAEEAAAE